ncbi:flavin-containing monooxygenase [Saccharopolyspora spinosa]|uniref:Cation diffusion facilitator CzcD-associated flavoprotein CzcO n=1 Tax=Saccharopolyspora spinosa TaxID=60894 RepID=A0A2N3Y006_SACSN|nr:NAD(P)/FAD-dependent oxidoreductase [Saccharopolyspora spinosa]PKW16256.1 cation diffusion facilitator CzcD-associated flavoprotein CzcO [Saccharopolyspora spinosa]
MRIAIIGAGFAGLSAAKVLTGFGHDVTAFEKAPDVGGVWSRSRRYPGLTTQNDKGTYSLSDFPMPKHYPEWPSGQQVQEYLESYARHFAILDKVRTSTEVLSAEPRANGGWSVTSADGCEDFEHLVVANGIFSEPFMPALPGTDEFRAAGGRYCPPSDFTEVGDARGRDVVVIGYGKSACDVAVALNEVSASTTVVARELLWKMPRMIGGALNYKYLLLTRLGEGLFRYAHLAGFEKFLHGPGRRVRNWMMGSLQDQIVRQLNLKKLGLVPGGSLEDIARSTVSLATEGFHEGVADGSITVHRDMLISSLGARAGKPVARLQDGTEIPADVIVAATGFHQRVPFLSQDIRDRLVDESGNFELYRQIHPHTVPDLSFCGYNSSFLSPLSAEVAALWIGVHLDGGLDLPPIEQRRAFVQERLRWMEERTDGNHARGTNIIPFSLHNIDEMLSDLGTGIGRRRRFTEWLLPVEPGVYTRVTRALMVRRARLTTAFGGRSSGTSAPPLGGVG